ncbi:MAG: TetR family transcriptional regulator [Pseudomonadales bacterium]|nr:TetR/AcrR family transcriptional regulator [Pseudomonadales bacterium]NIX08404.1 TetR family transcriptional regulator [Pseudomonadales bacterium]
MSLREEKKRQVRADILDAARELIEQTGYDDSTMRDIAATARVSYQTLYNYFPTKAAILAALLDDVTEQAIANVEALVDGYDGRLMATLNAINRARIDLVSRRGRELWRVISVDRLRQGDDAGAVHRRLDAAAGEMLQRLLAMARQRGELVADVDVHLLGDTLEALGEQAMARYLDASATSRRAVAESLAAQTSLLVTPYLKGAP